MMDEIEHLGCKDKDHIKFLILRHMKDEHGLDEGDMTEEELQAVESMSRIFETL